LGKRHGIGSGRKLLNRRNRSGDAALKFDLEVLAFQLELGKSVFAHQVNDGLYVLQVHSASAKWMALLPLQLFQMIID
jgi:hypothetical protein